MSTQSQRLAEHARLSEALNASFVVSDDRRERLSRAIASGNPDAVRKARADLSAAEQAEQDALAAIYHFQATAIRSRL